MEEEVRRHREEDHRDRESIRDAELEPGTYLRLKTQSEKLALVL